MHIASDMDDVVVDFIGGVQNSFYIEFGEWYEVQDAWGQEVVDFYTHPLLHEAGYTSWWDWLRERDWLWGIFPAYPGAIGSLQILHAQGHYIELITSKPNWARPQVARWVGKWRPYHDKLTIVSPGVRKIDATAADLIIDDKPQTCNEFIEEGRQAILFSPHGQLIDQVDARVCIARTWADVRQLVKELELKELELKELERKFDGC